MNIKNFLFVENDAYWMQEVSNNFNNKEIKIQHTSNLVEAMQLISTGSNLYHCVVINMNCVPQNSNLQAIVNNIKNVAPFIKIVFVLDNNDPYKIVAISQSDANGYLIKPYTLDALLIAMDKSKSDIKVNGLSDLGIPGRSDNMGNNNMQSNFNMGMNPNMGGNNMQGNPMNMGGMNNNMGINQNMNMGNNIQGNFNMGNNNIQGNSYGNNPMNMEENNQGNFNMGMNPNINMQGNPMNIGGMNNNMGINQNMNMGNNMQGDFNMGMNTNTGYNNMQGNHMNTENVMNNNMGMNPNMGGNNMQGNPMNMGNGMNQNMNMGNNNNMQENNSIGMNPNMSGMNMNGNGMNYNPTNRVQQGRKGVVRIPKNTTISVHCPKGGVGKSSISKELAITYALSQVNGEKLKVCLIDMDIDYGDIAIMVDLKQSKSIADWARNIRQRISQTGESEIRYSYDEVDRFYLLNHKSGLKILAAPTNTRDTALINEDIVKIIVNNLKSMFDVIIIDTGNNTKDFTITSMLLSDKILMVGNTDISTINEILMLNKTLEQIQFPINKISLLMNEVKKGEEQQVQEIATYLGLNLIGKLPKISAIEQSNNNGDAISMNTSDNLFTVELKKVANSILPVVKKPNLQGKNEKKGFFGFFKKKPKK